MSEKTEKVTNTAFEIRNSVEKSSQRITKPDALKARTGNRTKSVLAFCRTTWIVRDEVLKSILENNLELISLWDCSLKVVNDTEIKGRILVAWQVMSAFDFLFGCCLGDFIFSINWQFNLDFTRLYTFSKSRTSNSLRYSHYPSRDRHDLSFDFFWRDIIKRKSEFQDIGHFVLSTQRNC